MKKSSQAGSLNSPGQPSTSRQQEPSKATHLTQRLKGSDASLQAAAKKQSGAHKQQLRSSLVCKLLHYLVLESVSVHFYWFRVFAAQHWIYKRSLSRGLMHLTHDDSSTEGRVEALYRRPLPRCNPLPPPPLAWLVPPSPLPLQAPCPQCIQNKTGESFPSLFLIWGNRGYSGHGHRRGIPTSTICFSACSMLLQNMLQST